MDTDPTPARVTLRDIARELGVSHVTVSLALRDHPRISKAMTTRVKQTAARLGYRPDPMLTALSHYRRGRRANPITASIAWINAWPKPEQLRSFREFDAYWRGARTAATKFGYRLEEFRLGGPVHAGRLHEILSARSIRGILLPPQQAVPDWSGFPWDEYFVVRFGRSLSTPRCHVVTADQVANTMIAFEAMRRRGYRRIGYLTDELDLRQQGHLFEAGYLVAQRMEAGTAVLPMFCVNEHETGHRKRAFADWLGTHRPDAILTPVPFGGQMLAEAGLKVPQDIGLAVTSILDAGADAGIDQHPEEIGRVGFLTLNSVINDGGRGVPGIFRQILVEGTWVDGTSLPERTHR